MNSPQQDAEPSTRVSVDLGPRSYQIHIGSGLLNRAGKLIGSAAEPVRGFIITHPLVDRLHGEALRRSITAFPTHTLLVPSGERQKSLRRASLLYDQLLDSGADRSSAIIAFGGGVIGDLAGFVAATYMRGTTYIQIPTTLLAQVDASVGGKVAVDHPKAKNLIGAFYQPSLVVADTSVLRTLRARDYRAGLAEVVKHGVIADAAFFSWLENNISALRRREPGAVAHVVRRSCEIKADVVRRDERESGLRAVLNFGHTIGHALESLTGYKALRHGEAIAIGMVAASRLAQHLGMIRQDDFERVQELLTVLHLPVSIPAISAEDILAAMRADKKAIDGVPRFVLPTAIGRVEVGFDVPQSAVQTALVDVGAST